jgi:hypothetical protein
MTYRLIPMTAAVAAILASGAVALAPSHAAARAKNCAAMMKLDPESTGTIDLAKAKQLASETFSRMDRGKKGTLTKSEVGGRLSAKEFSRASGGKGLNESKYLALVEQRFARANRDADRTIDCKELNSRSGKALQRLLK